MSSPSAPSTNTESQPKAGFLRRWVTQILEFWRRVTEGMEMEALWKQFAAEAKAGYTLYSRDVDWDAVERKHHWKWWLHVARSFFWALLMKLSPPRRVILLLAIAMMILSAAGFTFNSQGAPNDVRLPEMEGLAAIVLFLLLALELADRVTMKRDLQIAREIQGWLVPSEPPAVHALEIAFATSPANTVSGDYYDAFWRGAAPSDPLLTGASPDTTVISPASSGAPAPPLLLVVADVAGKSVPAALLMAT
ncbi:MAG: PP2C family protein-serine/threonine phosphatase, partial [Bryobacteraceae bacterium]